VKLRHYRSIAGCDVELGQLSFLVGANGSGKSSFLDALRLVSDALQTTLDHALRDRGGIAEVRRRATGHPTHFGIRLKFSYGEFIGEYGFQVAAVKGGDFRVSHEDCFVSGPEHGPEDSLWPGAAHFSIRDGRLISGSEKVMPSTLSTDRLYLVSASGLPVFRDVFEGLAGVNVYNLNPDAMRNLQTPDSGEILKRDGSNIGSVVERLRRDNPAIKERIEEYLRRIVEGISWVNRQGLGTYETIEFGQRVAGAKAPWAFQATSISDGTLRALGVLTALFSGSGRILSTIGIEEPESALHPGATALLLDALRDASTRRQVLVTSHSPDLLDNPTIAPDELLAVTIAGGQTAIGPVDDTARYALEHSLYTAGELLRVDQIRPKEDVVQQLGLFT
jgi:predicted ATPase